MDASAVVVVLPSSKQIKTKQKKEVVRMKDSMLGDLNWLDSDLAMLSYMYFSPYKGSSENVCVFDRSP